VEATMTVYYPFIHNPKKRKEMFVPLHIEIEPPPSTRKLPEDETAEKETKRGVTIIEL
jgi:hypothetical protein